MDVIVVVAVVLVVWMLLGVLVALLVGRAIHLRDTAERSDADHTRHQVAPAHAQNHENDLPHAA